MKIEKLSNNKLKVIFSIKELEKENIDYHSFMAGSNKCEGLISNLLYIAKDELEFDTRNCNIEIETLEVNHSNFVLTITKYEKVSNKLKTKRKHGNIKDASCIYEFDNLDNYYDFISFLKSNKTFKNVYNKFKNNSELASFSNKFLLIINGYDFADEESKIFNTCITEFASFKSNSDALILKIKENSNK